MLLQLCFFFVFFVFLFDGERNFFILFYLFYVLINIGIFSERFWIQISDTSRFPALPLMHTCIRYYLRRTQRFTMVLCVGKNAIRYRDFFNIFPAFNLFIINRQISIFTVLKGCNAL